MFPRLRMQILQCAGAWARLICADIAGLDAHRVWSDCAASSLQAVRCQVQRLHGEDRADGVRDARAGVRVPPELLLLLRLRAPAEERGRVCPQGRAAALQKWLWERERLVELGQPRRLRLRWVFPQLLWLEKLHESVELSYRKIHPFSHPLHPYACATYANLQAQLKTFLLAVLTGSRNYPQSLIWESYSPRC